MYIMQEKLFYRQMVLYSKYCVHVYTTICSIHMYNIWGLIAVGGQLL